MAREVEGERGGWPALVLVGRGAHGIVLSKFLLRVMLFLLFGLFVFSNLLLATTSLGAGFHNVSTGALCSTDSSTGYEGVVYLFVHLNIKISIIDDGLVPGLNQIVDPGLKRRAD